MSKIGWIGLGVMGYPLAGHLKMRGHHDVVVFNRTRKRADAWVATFGGTAAPTPATAARDADFVFTCVGNDDDLREVTLGPNGAFPALKPGAVAIDNTTASAEIARELHAAAKARGAGFLDAPVSGGQSGAENGTLTVMVGGDEEDFRKAEPVIKAYARAVTLIGPSGSASSPRWSTRSASRIDPRPRRGASFRQAHHLDIPKVIDTISKGAAQSWQMENRWKTMVEGKFDFGFSVDLVRKDFALVFDEARRNGAELPVTALVDQFYAEVQAIGGRRWDTSSLIALLERKISSPAPPRIRAAATSYI